MYEMAKNLSVEDRADSSTVPNLDSFYYVHKKFKMDKFGGMGGNKMFQVIEEFAKSSDASISVRRKGEILSNGVTVTETTIAIVTPLILRVLANIEQSGEILFMDTTSCIDSMNTNATIIMTWSPVGGLPVGFILSESQCEQAYAQGIYKIRIW